MFLMPLEFIDMLVRLKSFLPSKMLDGLRITFLILAYQVITKLMPVAS